MWKKRKEIALFVLKGDNIQNFNTGTKEDDNTHHKPVFLPESFYLSRCLITHFLSHDHTFFMIRTLSSPVPLPPWRLIELDPLEEVPDFGAFTTSVNLVPFTSKVF